MTRSQQLAGALIRIADSNHYMVGLTEPVSLEELQEAYQILINIDNVNSTRTTRLAVDVCETKIREAN